MKNQTIELNDKTDIFTEKITIVKTKKLLRMLPNLELKDNADEFVVKKHENYLELIPY
jgi:hypothetical protein